MYVTTIIVSSYVNINLNEFYIFPIVIGFEGDIELSTETRMTNECAEVINNKKNQSREINCCRYFDDTKHNFYYSFVFRL